jgi:flavorubredoxin
MAGDLQRFLERAAERGKGDIAGKPYGAFVTYGETGRAITSIEAMAGLLKLKNVAASVGVKGFPNERDAANLTALGTQLAKCCVS